MGRENEIKQCCHCFCSKIVQLSKDKPSQSRFFKKNNLSKKENLQLFSAALMAVFDIYCFCYIVFILPVSIFEKLFICNSNYASFMNGNIISLRRKNKTIVILKTGRFDNKDSAVIISSVSKAVQN